MPLLCPKECSLPQPAGLSVHLGEDLVISSNDICQNTMHSGTGLWLDNRSQTIIHHCEPVRYPTMRDFLIVCRAAQLQHGLLVILLIRGTSLVPSLRSSIFKAVLSDALMPPTPWLLSVMTTWLVLFQMCPQVDPRDTSDHTKTSVPKASAIETAGSCCFGRSQPFLIAQAVSCFLGT